MRELSLFSGAGGGLLGTYLLGWRPIGYVEWDDYCQRIIAARIKDGILPNAPIFGDIRAFLRDGYAASYQGLADVITGGFPCQPFSVAGKQLGADDPRNMWPATIECIRVVRPRFALLENVPGLLTSGYFGSILGDLAAGGYDVRWRVLSAAEVGAPHRRDRLWIVAVDQGSRKMRLSVRPWGSQQAAPYSTGVREDMAFSDRSRRNGRTHVEGQSPTERGWTCEGREALADSERVALGDHEQHEAPNAHAHRPAWWAIEPDVGRTLDGLAKWLDFPKPH